MWPYSNHTFTPYGAEPLIQSKIGNRAVLRPIRDVYQAEERNTASFFIKRNYRTTHDYTYKPHSVADSYTLKYQVAERTTKLRRRKTAEYHARSSAETCPENFVSIYQHTHVASANQLDPYIARNDFKPMSSFKIEPSHDNETQKQRSFLRVSLTRHDVKESSYARDIGSMDPRHRVPQVEMRPNMNEMSSSAELELSKTARPRMYTAPNENAPTTCHTKRPTTAGYVDEIAKMSSTQELHGGTTKVTSGRPAGYMGVIPRTERVRKLHAKTLDHPSAVDTARSHSKDMLRHYQGRHLPGYAGFQPRALVNDISLYEPIRLEGTSTHRTTNAYTMRGQKLEEPILQPPSEHNLRKYLVSNFFTAGSDSDAKGDGAANAERFYSSFRPLEGRIKYGAPPEREWVQDNVIRRTYMFVGKP